MMMVLLMKLLVQVLHATLTKMMMTGFQGMTRVRVDDIRGWDWG